MSIASIQHEPPVNEGFVEIDGVEMYRVDHFDELPAFLMSITSDTNLWMYVSSTGGLTAGRVDENSSLFPYETEDRLHRVRGVTGPITLMRVSSEARPTVLWEPLDLCRIDTDLERNLYKTPLGNRLIFEETHKSVGLTFQYEWTGCDEFGFVRTARLTNNGQRAMRIELLDGLLNLLPAGVKLHTVQTSSCLVDAYKRCEIDPNSGLAIYSLTAMVSDRPEPAECLRASAVWSRGLRSATTLLNEDAVRAFRSNHPMTPTPVTTGSRGAFLLHSTVTLAAGEFIEWDIVADIGFDQPSLEGLRQWLISSQNSREQVRAKLAAADLGLNRIVAACDGMQLSADRAATAHHAANVLFNTMRGGLPIDGYNVCVDDFIRFVKDRNASVYLANESTLNHWSESFSIEELIRSAQRTGVADLIRLAYEYLPLTFGRRHGDPSRPWNRFAIHLKNADGSRRIGYQGNWRDIFQNWEALAFSYPGLIESFIAKFLNASTIDGFNPYRVSQDGIEWETLEPDNPWSNIGYWGDHQIIYLLKLLEASTQFHPGELQRLLGRPIFSYANVPYRLKSYSLLTQNPRNSLEFDQALHREIENRVKTRGADGKLLLEPDGAVYHATLLEKLLVPLLSKLSNFVAGGGIWMNTQRPEWNDANNALAGNGVSMVTLCYLRRYTKFVLDLLEPMQSQTCRMSAEVVEWADQITAVLAQHRECLTGVISDGARRELLDELGAAFDAYRQKTSGAGFSGKVTTRIDAILPLLVQSMAHLDRTIQLNARPDGLFGAYNLLNLSTPHAAALEALPEMLEGQVAALSSGTLSIGESVKLLQASLHSRLWREDACSLMLYPRTELPRFLDKNCVPADRVERNPLLSELLTAGDSSIITRDVSGAYRFNGDFQQARDLETALTRLGRQSRWQSLVVANRKSVLDVFEAVFRHHAFTGRSGTMYAYEGLGCVYWHMVAKLLLAVQELFWNAADVHAPEESEIAQLYYQLRSGLGFNKTAREYGAIPVDPYSHTPASGGARQPGMTGQVKEEILTRLGECGIRIRGGQIHFQLSLMRAYELTTAPSIFHCIDAAGNDVELELPANSLALTLGQTPILYHANLASSVEIQDADGGVRTQSEMALSREDSAAIFNRSGKIRCVRVSVPLASFRAD
jgi:hypothetical protein